MKKESVYDKMTNAEKEMALLLKNTRVLNGNMNIQYSFGMKTKDQGFGHQISYLIPFRVYVEVCGSEQFDYEYRKNI